jgi:hypothetical protein
MPTRKHRTTVATATAHSNTMVPAFHMSDGGMFDSMTTVATAISGMTTAMSSTSIHRRRYCQETCHHERSKC